MKQMIILFVLACFAFAPLRAQKRTVADLEKQTAELRSLAARDSVLRAQILLGDSSIIRYGNRRLYERFNRDLVNHASRLFSRIHSTELKGLYGEVGVLLNRYEADLTELRNGLVKAEKWRKDNKFSPDIFMSKANHQFKGLSYYRKYYSNESWTIPHLNELYKAAFEETEKGYKAKLPRLIKKINRELQ